MVQKSGLNENFNLIYKLIQKGMKVSHVESGKEKGSICALLGLSKQAISYYTAILKRAGMIERRGFGVWETIGDYNEEAIKQVKKTIQVTPGNVKKYLNLMKEDNVREHGLAISLDIPKIDDWHMREEILRKKGVEIKHLDNLGGGVRIIFEGRKIHLKNNSIIIYETLNFLGELASDTDNLAMYNFFNLVKRLGIFLGKDLTVNKRYDFKVSRRHFSLVKNSFAHQINKKGIKLRIYDDAGKWWFSVDKSFCNDEAETVNPKTGGDDNKGFQKIFNSYRNTNYEVTSEYVLDMFREIGVQINAVVQNFNYHGENLKTHVGAIQELKSGVNILTNKIDTFSQIVDNLKIIVGRALNKNS